MYGAVCVIHEFIVELFGGGGIAIHTYMIVAPRSPFESLIFTISPL